MTTRTTRARPPSNEVLVRIRCQHCGAEDWMAADRVIGARCACQVNRPPELRVIDGDGEAPDRPELPLHLRLVPVDGGAA